MSVAVYVFPHPDDESFGPAAVMHRQRREGHEVHLLTLTRGEATRVRHELGLSREEMGAVRYREMEAMARQLNLSSLTVLHLPDGALKEVDPREIEAAVSAHIEALRPNLVVTYPAHGVSGFEDHLVTHAAVKRVFCELRDRPAAGLMRLAFTTLRETPTDRPIPLRASKPHEIDCAVPVTPEDRDVQRRALACYESYRKVIEDQDPASVSGDHEYFEVFRERHMPPLPDLFAGL